MTQLLTRLDQVLHFFAQAAQRGQKQAVSTEADANDPLKDQYGDSELVQSQDSTKRKWSRVESLNKDSKDTQVGKIEMQLTASLLQQLLQLTRFIYSGVDTQVLLRGRVATVRGKGKSAFLVLRQRTATVQVSL